MGLNRHDELDPASVPALGKTEIGYPTPNIADKIVVEKVPISPEKYEPIPYHSPHPTWADTGLILVWQGKVRSSNNQTIVVRVYTNNLANDDWYNSAIHYSGDAVETPIFLRQYVELRENYVALPKASPLTTLMRLRVTAMGSGFTSVPAVAITGGGGSGATARAIMSPDKTKVIGLELLTSGTGFTSNPTVAITGGGGTGATATAEIQPVGAVLVKEETAKLPSNDQLASLFIQVIRVYETLPGPWILSNRWDDNLGFVQVQKRAVLNAGHAEEIEAFNDGTRAYTWRLASGRFILASADPDDPDKWLIDVVDETGSENATAVFSEIVSDDVVGHWTFEQINGVWVLTENNPEESTSPAPVIPEEFDDFFHIVSQQESFSSATGTTTFEARDGSSVVLIETIESWADNPYDREFSVELPDNLPEKFKADLPTTTSGVTTPGTAQPPQIDDSQGELSKSSREVNKFWKRDTVTRRDPLQFPKTLIDLEIGGIQARGSEFGGILEIPETIHNQPQTVDEGFFVLESSVKQLGRGRSIKRTKRLAESQGASLLLTNPGQGFEDNPAVLFSAGERGSGAAATAQISVLESSEPVVVQRNYIFDGDDHGVFFYLGRRGGNGTWRNPHTGGDIDIGADGPVVGELVGLVDRQPSNTYTDEGSSRAFYFDLKAGRSLICNRISYRQRSDYHSGITYFQLQGTNTLGVTPNWTPLTNVTNVPRGMNEWVSCPVPNGVLTNGAFRRFRIITNTPWFTVGEVELYGTLSIAAEAISNGVTGVEITNGGSGYAIAPAVLFEGDGVDAAGTAVIEGGSVVRVLITNTGRDYTTAPDITFVVPGGGADAAATAIIDGQVISVDVSDGGDDYETPPDVVFGAGPGGFGHDAAAVAVLGFGLESIDVTDPGNGDYGSPPTVVIDPPEGATAHAILSHILETIGVTNGGTGYSTPPDVIIDAPTGAGGVQATAHAVMGAGGSTDTDPFTYVSDGDANGVVDFIGRNFGVGSFSNPHNAGDVVVTRSTNTGSPSNIIVDRLTVGDGHTNNDANSWIAIDLDPNVLGMELVVNTYSLRNRSIDGSRAMRNWKLQGSNDAASNDVGDLAAATWVDIDTRVSDTDMATTANAWGTYVVSGTPAAYRWFRILQNGANANGDDYLVFQEWELYGDFTYVTGGVPTDEVASIVIDDPGYGYLVDPDVELDGDGTGALAFASLVVDGYIDSVVIDTPGLFETAPDIDFTGDGTGATGSANLAAGGSVIRVDLTDSGNDYQGPPLVTFDAGGGPGTGALATATIEGPVTGFSVTNGGSGYAEPPNVNIVSGSGSGTTGTAVLTGDVVTSITLDSPGSGYALAPTVDIAAVGAPEGEAIVGFPVDTISVVTPGADYSSPPPVHIAGNGILAFAQAILGFAVDQVVIGNRGQGYTSNPTPVFSGGDGTGAAGTAVRGFAIASVALSPDATMYLTVPEVVVSGGGPYGRGAQFKAFIGRPLLSIFMEQRGNGYLSDPDVVITDDTGVDGDAHAIRSFAVASIAVDSGGSSYLTPPDVLIAMPTGNNGRRATAHAVLTAGAVTSIVIDDPGYGYLTTSGVTFSGGAGTGATATATLASTGAIDSIVIDDVGVGYSDPTISFSGGGGTDAVASARLNTGVSGFLVAVNLTEAGSGYTSVPLLTIAGNSGLAVPTLSTSGQVVAVTMTSHGSGYVAPTAVIFTGGGGSGATGTGFLEATGKIKSITVVNGGEGFTEVPDVTIPGGATATAFLDMSAGKIKTLTLIFPGGPFSIPPLVSFMGGGGTGATALYLLETGFTTFTETQTDPTEGIRIIMVKDIVEPEDEIPSGFVDRFPLEKYRSIQIVSRIDLNTLPVPDIYRTSQSVSFPPLLVAVTPIWDQATSFNSTNNPISSVGSSAVTLSVHGSILVLKRGGFRGAAIGRVERRFFFGPPPDNAVPEPTIIRPSSGTAIIRGASNASGRRGSTAPTLFLNQWGDPIPVGGLYGYGSDGSPIYLQGLGGDSLAAGNSGSSSSTTQIVDINNVMTPGLAIGSDFVATIDQNAAITQPGTEAAQAQLHVEATARGAFSVSIPGSCPAAITPGMAILAQVGVEKWRLGLYVRTIVYLDAPGYCGSAGS